MFPLVHTQSIEYIPHHNGAKCYMILSYLSNYMEPEVSANLSKLMDMKLCLI